MEEKELIELIIHERLSLYFKENPINSQEEMKKSDEFLLLIKKNAPELEKEFLSYLDWIAEHSGNEQENLYLFGVWDGVRLMKNILHML